MVLGGEENLGDNSHWVKSKNTSELDTTSLSKTLSHRVYRFSQLYFVKPQLFQTMWDF